MSLCRRPADVGRDQWLLLRPSAAKELRRLVRGDTSAVRLLGQGPAVYQPHEEAARRRHTPREFLRVRRARAAGEARTNPLATATKPWIQPGAARRVFLQTCPDDRSLRATSCEQ